MLSPSVRTSGGAVAHHAGRQSDERQHVGGSLGGKDALDAPVHHPQEDEGQRNGHQHVDAPVDGLLPGFLLQAQGYVGHLGHQQTEHGDAEEHEGGGRYRDAEDLDRPRGHGPEPQQAEHAAARRDECQRCGKELTAAAVGAFVVVAAQPGLGPERRYGQQKLRYGLEEGYQPELGLGREGHVERQQQRAAELGQRVADAVDGRLPDDECGLR